MKYTIVEEFQDGRSYALIERDDLSTFGQIVDLRGAADDAEADALVLQAVSIAKAISKAMETRENASKVNRIGIERPLPEAARAQ